MRLIDIDILNASGKIDPRRIVAILKSSGFRHMDIQDYEMCDEFVKIDDIYIYDDIINAFPGDINNIKIIKKDPKNKHICFKRPLQKIYQRPLKQVLSDISTKTIIENLQDDEYEAFICDFYNSVNIVIRTYARMKQLSIPNDICFFYKGGNMFRILLKDVISLFQNDEYHTLLKRSDADFQLYINPNIENYEKIFEELSILVTFVLYCMKRKLEIDSYGFRDVYEEYKTVLEERMGDVLDNVRDEHKIGGVVSITEKKRKDCIIDIGYLYNDEHIIYKDTPSILTNIQKVPISNFYISRNTSIKFSENNSVSEFDLLRMKMNIVLTIGDDVNKIHVKKIPVPSEVIDISIPKGEDSSLRQLTKFATKYLVEYTFEKDGRIFKFWAPSLQYLIKDLDNVMFVQNIFPWYDKKSIKRIERYFMSIFVHSLVARADGAFERIVSYKKELLQLRKLLECINENTTCEPSVDHTISSMFYKKYMNIYAKLNTIKNEKRRNKELVNMRLFNEDVIAAIHKLHGNIRHFLSNVSDRQMFSIHNHIRKTSILG